LSIVLFNSPMTLEISAIDDPRLNPYRDLPRAPRDQHSPRFIAESEIVVRRLLASGYAVESLLATQAMAERLAEITPAHTSVMIAPPRIIKEIIGYKFHQGVLACAHREPRPLSAELPTRFDERALLVACCGVLKPDNLGAIVRASAAFGACGMLVDERCADPLSRRVLRVSMGNVFKIPVVRTVNVAGEIDRLRREHSFRWVATVADQQAVPLDELPASRRTGVVFGSEGDGLSPEMIAHCDVSATIPMRADIDSLNVTMATAIFLHELTRRIDRGR
jgi:tRNA G18 (ribose-2'-O)-methylase SpoU